MMRAVLDGRTRRVCAIAAAAGLARLALYAGQELYSDEAYYWLWSLRPATGYFDHPPMVAWVIALSTALAPGELGVRLLFVALGALAVRFAALTARELSDDPRAPVFAALLAAAAPLLSLTGALALPDAPVEAAYGAATWLLARARGRRWLWAGAAVGLALLSKYTAALLAPALVALVAWDRELRRELRTPWPWAAGLLAVAIFAPCLLWNAQHDWVSIRFQLGHGFNAQNATWWSFLLYLGGQFGGAGPVALVLGIALLVRARTSPEKRVAAATLLPIAVTFYSALRRPVEANWPALAFPGLCAAAGVALSRLGAGRARVAAVASVAFGLVALVGYGVELRRPRILDAASRPVERFHGWREFAREARAAAERACAAVGSPPACDPADPFVFTHRYQHASELAFYAGWRRFGPTSDRVSQFDVWGDLPPAGAPFLYVSGGSGVTPAARRRLAGEGEGETIYFEANYAGARMRTGSLTPFGSFLGFERSRWLAGAPPAAEPAAAAP